MYVDLAGMAASARTPAGQKGRYRHVHRAVSPRPPRPAQEPLPPRGPHPAPPARLLIQPTRPAKPATSPAAAPGNAAEIIEYLRASQITLTYDPRARTLTADTSEAVTVTIDWNAGSGSAQPESERRANRQAERPAPGRRPGPGDNSAYPKTAIYVQIACPRGESPLTYMPVISGELVSERRSDSGRTSATLPSSAEPPRTAVGAAVR
jgi:hypothetical protein